MRRILALLLGLIVLAPPLLAQEGAPHRELRERHAALEREYKEVVGNQGENSEAAERIRHEMAAIRKKASADAAEGVHAERRKLEEQVAKFRAELEEATRNGQQDRAAELKHRLERLHNALHGKPEGKAPASDAARRLEHMVQAVQHLREAGMKDLAGRVEEEARQLKSRMHEEAARPPAGDEDHLRRQLQEAHQRLEEMGRRMEEMARRLEELSRERRP